jgi:hypothetical protein
MSWTSELQPWRKLLAILRWTNRHSRSLPNSRVLKRRGELRPSDIFIASYPRSGNTWFQILLSDVIQQLQGLATQTELTVANDRIIPDLDRGDPLVTDPRITLPFRLIKTHSFYHPSMQRVILVFRRPASSLCSYYHLLHDREKTRPKREHLDVDSFCRRYLSEWSAHLESYLRAIDRRRLRAFVLFYKQLHDAPAAVVAGAAQFLGLPATEAMCRRAVANHTFHKQSSLEARKGESITAARFFRQGRVDGARDELSPETMDFVELRAMPLYRRAQGYASIPLDQEFFFADGEPSGVPLRDTKFG